MEIVGAYSGNVRSTGTFAITDRSVNELPIPRFLRAITIPVNQFARRLFSSTSTLTLTTSPGRNGTTALDAAISRIFSSSSVCMMNLHRFWYVLRLRSCDVGVNALIPPPPLPKLGSFRRPASQGVSGGSIPRGGGFRRAPSETTFIDFGSREANRDFGEARNARTWEYPKDRGGEGDVRGGEGDVLRGGEGDVRAPAHVPKDRGGVGDVKRCRQDRSASGGEECGQEGRAPARGPNPALEDAAAADRSRQARATPRARAKTLEVEGGGMPNRGGALRAQVVPGRTGPGGGGRRGFFFVMVIRGFCNVWQSGSAT